MEKPTMINKMGFGVYPAREMDAFLEEQAAKLKDVLCFNEYEDEKKFEIMRALRGKAKEKEARGA